MGFPSPLDLVAVTLELGRGTPEPDEVAAVGAIGTPANNCSDPAVVGADEGKSGILARELGSVGVTLKLAKAGGPETGKSKKNV